MGTRAGGEGDGLKRRCSATAWFFAIVESISFCTRRLRIVLSWLERNAITSGDHGELGGDLRGAWRTTARELLRFRTRVGETHPLSRHPDARGPIHWRNP